jgi:hypothetical protein
MEFYRQESGIAEFGFCVYVFVLLFYCNCLQFRPVNQLLMNDQSLYDKRTQVYIFLRD